MGIIQKENGSILIFTLITLTIVSIIASLFYSSHFGINENQKKFRTHIIGIDIARLVLGSLQAPINFPKDLSEQLRGNIANPPKVPNDWYFYPDTDDSKNRFSKNSTNPKSFLFKLNETRFFDSEGNPVEKAENAYIFLRTEIKIFPPDKVGTKLIYHPRAAYRIWFRSDLNFSPLGAPMPTSKNAEVFSDDDFKIYIASKLYKKNASQKDPFQSACQGEDDFALNGFVRESGWPYCVKKINEMRPKDSYAIGIIPGEGGPKSHGGQIRIKWQKFNLIGRDKNYYPKSFSTKAKYKNGVPITYIYLFNPMTSERKQSCPSTNSSYHLDPDDQKFCLLSEERFITKTN
jgi:hypothetical protein